MPNQVSKTHLCVSVDIGPDVTVDRLIKYLEEIQATGRGHFKVQLDDDQHGTPMDVRSLQVFDGDQIVELTHS
jgi:hypothetical protein